LRRDQTRPRPLANPGPAMPTDLIQSGNKLLANTIDGWEEAMRPVADVRVREVLGPQFSAEMQLFKLPRTAFFSLKLPRARVVVPEGSGFVGVTIVSSGQMRTASPRRGGQWEAGTAHAVNHDDYSLDFASDEHLESMALCFQKPLLQEYARKFHGRDDSRLEQDTADLILNSSAGACFTRYATFVWEELNRGGAFLQSPLATEEIEDGLWALLLSALQGERRENGHQRSGGYAIYVKPAEEFILGHLDTPIRVADIAAAVGISVPTLNRAFRKCHGMGPKAFVKQRRLDRVRSELHRADPRSTTVTAIATKYGFWHLSQFAADFKSVFNEAPSDTLRRN
jgi:AraC-like DNA-binding protein